MPEVKGKLIVKASNGKGFKIEGDEGWFNANDEAAKYLAKFEKGDVLVVTWEKDKVSRKVTKVVKAEEIKKEENPAAFTCEDCGATLKDGKYKKCYMCNKKAPAKTETKSDTGSSGTGSSGWTKSNYGSAEDVAGKEVGCSANCAASILAGRQEDPETLLEMFRILCNGILEHVEL